MQKLFRCIQLFLTQKSFDSPSIRQNFFVKYRIEINPEVQTLVENNLRLSDRTLPDVQLNARDNVSPTYCQLRRSNFSSLIRSKRQLSWCVSGSATLLLCLPIYAEMTSLLSETSVLLSDVGLAVPPTMLAVSKPLVK